MKSTGIIRRIDELGRIVVPKEIRNSLEINSTDNIEIYVENDSIILKKYSIIGHNIILNMIARNQMKKRSLWHQVYLSIKKYNGIIHLFFYLF